MSARTRTLAPFAALLALAMAAATIMVLSMTSEPAHASRPDLDTVKTKCVDVGESAKVCLDVYWHDMAGGGVTVNHVYERISGGFWETKAIDCDNLRLWNQNDVVKWRKDDAECDVDKSPGYTLWAPSLELDGATSVTVGWTFYPKLDKERDPGRTHISVTVS